MIDVRPLTGPALEAALPDVAALRIKVFWDWPYLYQGDLDYEANYLKAYLKPGAIVVAAFDGARMVGASTGAPMEDHATDFAYGLPRDWRHTDVFYCAESVLLADYRGHGIGHRFFDLREDHARALQRTKVCFCSVMRPDDHPMRPAGYRPLNAFWKKRGYEPVPGAIAQFAWKDRGMTHETQKSLQFWARDL